MIFLIFVSSLYPNFKWLLLKTLLWILRILSNFYYVTNILEQHIFDNETAALLIFFLNLHGYAFCFFIFSNNLPFEDTFKMYCCAWWWFKFKFQKQTLLKLWVVEYAISFLFFCYFLFMFILLKFLSKYLWNNYHF